MASPNRDWSATGFGWFAERLTLLDGRRLRLEPFQRFVVSELFAPGRRELVALMPKGQGKTLLLAALAVWHVLTVRNAECFIGAADKEQADQMYRFARHFVESEPELGELLLVRKSTREIRSRRDTGFIRVLASDSSSSGGRRHSYNPTLALVDELHAHENDHLYVAMRSAAFKRDGLVVTISTAGHDVESTLGRLRSEFLRLDAEGGTVAHGLAVSADGRAVPDPAGRLTVARVPSGRTVLLEWSCRPGDDLSDPAVVKRANPASFVTEDSLADAMEAPGITAWAFARYRANVWTPGFESWLPAGAWDALADPDAEIPDGATVFAAVDMARYSDSAAIALVWRRTDGVAVVRLPFVERSRGQDDPIDYQRVKAAIHALHDRYRVTVAFDPQFFDQAADELETEGVEMVVWPQRNERMCPASMGLRRAILSGELVHDGDPVLARHVTAGAVKDVGPDLWRLVKSRRRGPHIDGLIALVMAHALAATTPPPYVGPLFEVIT